MTSNEAFRHKIDIITAQQLMLRRITNVRNLDDLLKIIDEEAARLKAETEALQKTIIVCDK